MPSEEGKQVLKLLADGKIDAEQAYRLLRAIGDIEDQERPEPHFGLGGGHGPGKPPFPPDPSMPPGLGRRTLRITVTSGGKTKVNIAIPLGIARMGKTKIAASGLVREQLAKFGIDLDDVLRHISHSGPIVDISDGDHRVMIVVE